MQLGDQGVYSIAHSFSSARASRLTLRIESSTPQIGTATKQLAIGSQQQSTHRFVVAHQSERIANLTDRDGAKRVEPLRLIQCDDCNGIFLGVDDCLVTHASSSHWLWLKAPVGRYFPQKMRNTRRC
ncbi:hypothetical protein D3C76_988860 [compost metagenome]